MTGAGGGFRGGGRGFRLEGDAFGGGEIGECHVGEGFLLGFLKVDVAEVHAVAGDAGAAGGFGALVLDDIAEAAEGISGAADGGDHSGGHFVEFGHGFLDFHVVDVAAEFVDFVAGGFDGNVAGADELLVADFGIGELFGNFVVLFVDGLELVGVFGSGFALAGGEEGFGFGAEVVFLGFEFLGLGQEALDESGVGGEAFVELTDLFAEVLFLDFQEGLRVLAFHAADEESEKAFEEIGDAFEHGLSGGIMPIWGDAASGSERRVWNHQGNCRDERLRPEPAGA